MTRRLSILALLALALLIAGCAGVEGEIEFEVGAATPTASPSPRPRPQNAPESAPEPPARPTRQPHEWWTLSTILEFLKAYRERRISIAQVEDYCRDAMLRLRPEPPAVDRPGSAGGTGLSGDSSEPPAQQSAAVRGVQDRSGAAFGTLPGGE